MRIELNKRERMLRDLLVSACEFIDCSDASVSSGNRERLRLRWAGGWVRDKLLGIESHDIDTAINVMTGEEFAVRLREFCDIPRHREQLHIGPDDVGRLHKVAANPERSKHLATATTRLFGLDVDFVNLRKETYATDSRNPVVEFGTAKEDALRRDATINALLYNLHTEEVEDCTGGVRDLQAKLIRTPLEPLQTFMDDPLRVLRLVRFASRLHFQIDPATEKGMSDSRVMDALRVKISRERVGIELEKMLKGNHPRVSLALIDRLALYHAIFTDPGRLDMPRPDISRWKKCYQALDLVVQNNTPGSIYELTVRGEDATWFAWVLAALAPWEQLPDDAETKPGKPALPLAARVAREGFRASNKLTDLLTAAHRHRAQIGELKRLIDEQQRPAIDERDRFGMTIRDWDSRGGQWRLQVLYSVLVAVMERREPVEEILKEWQRFLDHLQELDVMDAPSIKRLVDGTTLAKALGVKPGKWMKDALDVVMAWQLRWPKETDPAGAIEEVRQRMDELGIK